MVWTIIGLEFLDLCLSLICSAVTFLFSKVHPHSGHFHSRSWWFFTWSWSLDLEGNWRVHSEHVNGIFFICPPTCSAITCSNLCSLLANVLGHSLHLKHSSPSNICGTGRHFGHTISSLCTLGTSGLVWYMLICTWNSFWSNTHPHPGLVHLYFKYAWYDKCCFNRPRVVNRRVHE